VSFRPEPLQPFIPGALAASLGAEPAVDRPHSDVRDLEAIEKAVRRDVHKMRAFVRFRKMRDEERYVAWFEPDHFIVERNAPFFVRRFTGMRWTLLTPYASADWDGTGWRLGQEQSRVMRPRKTPPKSSGEPILKVLSILPGSR
jgi:probable DNA metabolism protein